MKTVRILSAWCLVMAIPAMAGAATIYVDADAPGANNGSSWINAFNYLQDGLAQASAGDTIRVAQGTYKPDNAIVPVITGRMATFQLKSGVEIYGGYAGYGAPNPNNRNVPLYKTILSGDLDGNDVLVEITDANLIDDLLNSPTRQENAYTVVTGSNVEPNALLDGFIITGGNANGPSDFPYMYERGGGFFEYRGSPTLKNCTFKTNSAASYGGAVANYQGKPVIESCTFRANYSTGGGAGISNWASDAKIRNSTFTWNNVYYQKWGGAMYNRDCNPELEGCTFTDNYGGGEGGAISNDNSDANMVDCRFVGNSAGMGGAVENTNGCFPTFKQCTFVENSALDWGGAMMNYNYSGPTLIDCMFFGNESSGAGGAVYNRYCQTNITLVNCLFDGNKASQNGGGLANFDTNIRLINCTFAANFSPSGKAVSCEAGGPTNSTHVTITNCILWDGGAEIVKSIDDLVTVTYSNVQGGALGTGNINLNPLFVNAQGFDLIPGNEDDDLRLAATSPCIDSGANYAVPIEITKDLGGYIRFSDDPATVDTGNGTPPIVDMGAYEFGSSIVPPGNNPPVANAGPNQTVMAGLGGYASVTLDGSGSYDLDGDPLFYYWSWTINSFPYQANGVSPTIQLPVGQHVLYLVVFDGTEYSSADSVVITVLGSQPPMQVAVWIHPSQIYRTSGFSFVVAQATLVGVQSSEVDMSVPVTLSPGNVEAIYQSISDENGGCEVDLVFNKSEITAAIPFNGLVSLTVTGSLTSSQQFQGSAAVWIMP